MPQPKPIATEEYAMPFIWLGTLLRVYSAEGYAMPFIWLGTLLRHSVLLYTTLRYIAYIVCHYSQLFLMLIIAGNNNEDPFQIFNLHAPLGTQLKERPHFKKC